MRTILIHASAKPGARHPADRVPPHPRSIKETLMDFLTHLWLPILVTGVAVWFASTLA